MWASYRNSPPRVDYPEDDPLGFWVDAPRLPVTVTKDAGGDDGDDDDDGSDDDSSHAA